MSIIEPRTWRNRFAALASAAVLTASIAWPGPSAAQELTPEVIEQVQRDAAEIRELAPLAEVSIQRVTQDELRAGFVEQLSDDETLAELALLTKANVLLGLIPAELDMQQTIVDLLSGAVVGQYRFQEKRMYLVGELDAVTGPEVKITLAHEYVHALQDQHFDLGSMTDRVKDHDDRGMAVRALVEGDATISELLYARERLSPEERAAYFDRASGAAPSSLEAVPFILRKELVFPYTDGFYFAIQLFQVGGYERINAAFANPPASTEQVIHVEKYLAGEEPIEVGLPDLLPTFGPGWKQSYTNVMGELELRILIENFTDGAMADRAGSGWGGDAYAILEGPDDRVVWVMDSTWDTETDAREFYDAFNFSLLRRFGSRLVVTKEEANRTIWETPVSFVGAGRWGSQIALVYAPDLKQVEATLELLAPGSPAPRQPVGVPAP